MRDQTTKSSTSSSIKRKRADPQGDHASKTSKRMPDSNDLLTKKDSKERDKTESSIESVQLQLSRQSGNSPVVHDGAQQEIQPTNMETYKSEPNIDDKGDAGSTQSVAQSFYLLRPGTSSAAKVLIPLESHATLTASLQDRTVQEYPTIYVLPEPRGSLPSKYLLENEYNKIRKGEEDELNEAIKQAGPAAIVQNMRGEETVAAANTQIDPQRILDMLKRDVTR